MLTMPETRMREILDTLLSGDQKTHRVRSIGAT